MMGILLKGNDLPLALLLPGDGLALVFYCFFEL
jgi:hypothetical protein